MNILLINHYAGSKDYGMVFRPYNIGRELVRMGHNVTIVAASYAHVRIKNPIVEKDLQAETIDGIRYVWLKTPTYKGKGYGRLVNMIVFISKLWMYEKEIGKMSLPDVVIASSTYNLEIYSAYRIAKRHQAKLCYEVRDLWPLTPMLMGGYSSRHPLIWAIQKAEDYAYKYANGVISLLCNAESYMREHGLAPGKFYYVPNGIVVEDWQNTPPSLPKEHLELLHRLKEEGKFIVGFAGAHGTANSLYAAIDALQSVEHEGAVLVLTGTGPEKEKLIAYAEKRQVKNAYFLPAISKQSIPALLEWMDALYIGLQKQPLFKYGISPNKLFDYMMAGKPIIQAIDAGNDIVSEAGCGISVEPDNTGEIGRAVIKLMTMTSAERKQLGQNGKNYVLKNHSYTILAVKYLKAIESMR